MRAVVKVKLWYIKVTCLGKENKTSPIITLYVADSKEHLTKIWSKIIATGSRVP